MRLVSLNHALAGITYVHLSKTSQINKPLYALANFYS